MLNNLSKKQRLILTLPLLLAVALFVPSTTVPAARGQFTGLACIVFPSTSTTCPTSSPTYGPFTVGQTFTVGVFISGSDAMGGLDIYVHSDPAFVSPMSAALGTLIASPSLTSICINGSAQTGSCTVGTANGAGVVEVTTIESSGSNECGGVSPCSGLAFTITYQVVGGTPSTTFTYPTAPGCSTSSVSSPSNVCVLVDDATGGTLPENVQTPGATITQTITAAQGVCITSPSTATSCAGSSPTITISSGSSFTVGVFVQNSQPLGGYDIYVAVDPNFLLPVGVSLGTLITSPSLTNICINDQSINGTCTVGTANRVGVVEVSTVESSGLNDPGTGLAFTITYALIHATPSTPIFYPTPTDPTSAGCSNSSVSSPLNVCVLIADNTGTTLSEGIQIANVDIPHPVDTTTVVIICSPNPVSVGQLTTCSILINDTATFLRLFPIGGPKLQSDGFGAFQPTNTCTLQQIGSTALSDCFITYEPLLVGNGMHMICAIYDPVHPPSFTPPDPTHSGNTGCTSVGIVPATPSISTAVLLASGNSNGLPPNGGFVPLGTSVSDNAFLFGGYNLTTGTGSVPPGDTVIYSVYANGACTAPSTSTSTVTVGKGNSVPSSQPFLPLVTGSFSFNARFNGDSNNNAVTSACEPFTVTIIPGFTAGKLHWTHHLSLSKSGSTQSWTAIVNNPLTANIIVVVRIAGSSAINPALSFDVTCGTVCVNTASGGVNLTNSTTVGPISIAAGATVSFNFNQLLPGSFANNKFSFTATVYWTTGTLNPDGTVTQPYTTGSATKSGSFAVVP